MSNTTPDEITAIAEAKRQLATPGTSESKKSATKRFVALMFDDIALARTASKTWEEIASNVSCARIISPDALRQAFSALRKDRVLATVPATEVRTGAIPQSNAVGTLFDQ